MIQQQGRHVSPYNNLTLWPGHGSSRTWGVRVCVHDERRNLDRRQHLHEFGTSRQCCCRQLQNTFAGLLQTRRGHSQRGRAMRSVPPAQPLPSQLRGALQGHGHAFLLVLTHGMPSIKELSKTHYTTHDGSDLKLVCWLLIPCKQADNVSRPCTIQQKQAC